MRLHAARLAENLIKLPPLRKTGVFVALPHKGSNPRKGIRTFSIENVLPAAPVHESGLIACVVFGAVFRNAFSICDSDAYREMNAADTHTLIAQADDARTAIKQLQQQTELWSDLKDQLRRARHEPNVGDVPLDELAAALMLNHGRRSLRPRKNAFLKQQGFPTDIDVDDTLLRSRRGY